MELKWFRVLEPPLSGLAEEALRSFLLSLPRGMLYNDGFGLVIGAPVEPRGLRVEPWFPPRSARARPWRTSELAPQPQLEVGVVSFKARRWRGLGRGVTLSMLTELQREWVDEVLAAGRLFFSACAVEFESLRPEGRGCKYVERVLSFKRPALAYRPMALSPSGLIKLAKSMSRVAFIDPPRRVDAALGAAAVVRVADRPMLHVGLISRRNNSMLIVGAPGTGKSVLVDRMLAHLLERGYSYPENIVILDPTGEHGAALLAYGCEVLGAGTELFINPLSLGPAIAREILEATPVEIMDGKWGYGPGASSALFSALSQSRTLADTLEVLGRFAAAAAKAEDRDAALAALRRLERLLHPALCGSGGVPRGRVVIDLSTMETVEQRAAFSLALLYRVYYEAQRGAWSGLLVVEEADRFGPHCDILNRVADELRKHDVHVWAAAHDVSRVPSALRGAKLVLFFRVGEEGALRYARELGFERPTTLPAFTLVDSFGVKRSFDPPPQLLNRRAPWAIPLPLSAVASREGVRVHKLVREYVANMDIAEWVVRLVRGDPVDPAMRRRVLNLGRETMRALAELYEVVLERRRLLSQAKKDTQRG